jgi:hypothetical protein
MDGDLFLIQNENDYDVSENIKSIVFSDVEESSEDVVGIENDYDDNDPEYVDDAEEEEEENELDSLSDHNTRISDDESILAATLDDLDDVASTVEELRSVLPIGTPAQVINLNRRLPIKLKRHEFEPIWDGRLELLQATFEDSYDFFDATNQELPKYSHSESIAVQFLENSHGSIASEDYELIRTQLILSFRLKSKFSFTLSTLRAISPESDLALLFSIYEIFLRPPIFDELFKSFKTDTKFNFDTHLEESSSICAPLPRYCCLICKALCINGNYRSNTNPDVIICPKCFKSGSLPKNMSSSEFHFRMGEQLNVDGQLKCDEISSETLNRWEHFHSDDPEMIKEFISLNIPDFEICRDPLDRLIGRPSNPIMVVLSLLATAVHPGIASEAAKAILTYLLSQNENEYQLKMFDAAKIGWEKSIEVATKLHELEQSNLTKLLLSLNKIHMQRISRKLDLLESFNSPTNVKIHSSIIHRLLSNANVS